MKPYSLPSDGCFASWVASSTIRDNFRGSLYFRYCERHNQLQFIRGSLLGLKRGVEKAWLFRIEDKLVFTLLLLSFKVNMPPWIASSMLPPPFETTGLNNQIQCYIKVTKLLQYNNWHKNNLPILLFFTAILNHIYNG